MVSLRPAIQLFSSRLVGAVISFGGIAFFARELNPEGIGVYFLFQSVLAGTALLTNFGTSGAVEKRLSEGNYPQQILGASLLLTIILVSISIFLLTVFSGPIVSYVGQDVLLALSIGILLRESRSKSLAVLRGEMRLGTTAKLEVLRQPVWLISSFLLFYAGFRINSLIYGSLIAMAVQGIIGWSLVDTSLSVPSLKSINSILRFSRHNVVSSFGGYLYNWTDTIIIGLLLGQAAVGQYEIAWRISQIVILLSKAIATVNFPEISNLTENNNIDKVEYIIEESIPISLIIVIPSFVGALIVGEETLGIVFGAQYVAASGALIVLMLDQVTESIQVIVGRALQAIDEPGLAAKATIIGVFINIILNFFLVSFIGILGAAIGTFVSSLVADSLHYKYLKELIDFRFPIKKLMVISLAAILMGCFILIIKTIYIIATLPQLLSMMLIAGALYFWILSQSGGFETEYRIAHEMLYGNE